MNHELLQAIVLYLRLVIYPLLSYTLIIYAYSVLYEKDKETSRLLTLLSFVFVLLWGASILYFTTRNNDLVVMYNSLGLIPVLVFTTIFLWVRICLIERTTKRKTINGDEANI